MEKVILETRQGGYVGTFDIPQMEPPPEVLTWGDRVFINSGSQGRNFIPVYREAFAVAIVNPPRPEPVQP